LIKPLVHSYTNTPLVNRPSRKAEGLRLKVSSIGIVVNQSNKAIKHSSEQASQSIFESIQASKAIQASKPVDLSTNQSIQASKAIYSAAPNAQPSYPITRVLE
jgi:hypothetical protein